MRKYNMIILAGGEDQHWCKQYGYKTKPFLPLNGKPMLEYVVNAFDKSAYVDKIIVVGPDELDELDCMKYVHKRVQSGKSFVSNLLRGICYIKAALYKCAHKHDGYLISFCDAAYLNARVVNNTIENLVKHDPGFALHYVPKEVIGDAGFVTENRTFMYVKDKPYTGANIYFVKKFSAVLRVLRDLVTMRKYRKTPAKMLEHLECSDQPFSYIEQVLSRKMKVKAKIFISPYAEMGVDIDKPIDYELARAQWDASADNPLAFSEKDLKEVCSENDELDVDT